MGRLMQRRGSASSAENGPLGQRGYVILGMALGAWAAVAFLGFGIWTALSLG